MILVLLSVCCAVNEYSGEYSGRLLLAAQYHGKVCSKVKYQCPPILSTLQSPELRSHILACSSRGEERTRVKSQVTR